MSGSFQIQLSSRSLRERAVRQSSSMSKRVLLFNARRSRWIGGLKLLLPAVAVAIVSLILLWPQLSIDEKRFRLSPTKVTREDTESVRMVHPRFVGVDERRRPFTVTADEAIQAAERTPKLQLVHPHADMTLGDGSWVTVSGQSGVYHSSERRLRLIGQVDVFHDSGAEFHTEEALIDLAAGAVFGTMPVEGQSLAGKVIGQGFEIRDRGAVVVFSGQAKAVLWSRGGP